MSEVIAIYGGTYNPPHIGHFAAAKAILDNLKPDRLLFIPAADPPHKQMPENSATREQRYQMTELMADNLRQDKIVCVSKIELEREGPSYSFDTVKQIARSFPNSELWLCMGTDMFMSFTNWYKPGEILEYCGICAFSRYGEDLPDEMYQQKFLLENNYNARIKLISNPDLVEISSTKVRELLLSGDNSFINENVYGYILKNNIYGLACDLGDLDIEKLRAVSYSMVKAKRIPHIKGVENEAIKLALHWGADVTNAQRAAILHDCTKYLTLPEQLKICSDYGIVLDDLEKTAVKLLHSKTGACLARYVFHENEDVCNAIYWHTTGNAEMTLLDKIVYIADYIEPNRDFEGVEKVRELAYKDLDMAMICGLEMTVEEMNQYHEPTHPNTIRALDFLKGVING